MGAGPGHTRAGPRQDPGGGEVARQPVSLPRRPCGAGWGGTEPGDVTGSAVPAHHPGACLEHRWQDGHRDLTKDKEATDLVRGSQEGAVTPA